MFTWILIISLSGGEPQIGGVYDDKEKCLSAALNKAAKGSDGKYQIATGCYELIDEYESVTKQ